MAKQTLPTNYKDDVLATSMGKKRRYNLIQNDDGTISLEDATEYTQVGDNYGAAQLNATNRAVNESVDQAKIIDSLDDIAANTQPGMVAGALAVAELNGKIELLNDKTASGHAMKMVDATENLVYGCWYDGFYRYNGYYGNGAPSDWAGVMLVTVIRNSSGIQGYIKIAWDMGMNQYIMKNSSDGSVSQAWTRL